METFDVRTGFAKKLFSLLNFKDFRVIAFTGGGGKTSLMFSLAKTLSENGRIAVTTTTKIFPPSKEQADLCFIGPALDAVKTINATREHTVITIAETMAGEKLAGYHPGEIGVICRDSAADWLLVEADGARRKPFKAYAEWEPPVPDCTDCQFVVVGADAFINPLGEENICRFDRFRAKTGLREADFMTAENAAAILNDRDEYLKNSPHHAYRVLFLNKAELLDETERARLVHALSASLKGYDRLIAASIRNDEIFADMALKRG